jgi:hypothetical protein
MALSEAIGARRMHSELLFAPSLVTADMDESKSMCQTIYDFLRLILAAMSSYEFPLLSLQSSSNSVNRSEQINRILATRQNQRLLHLVRHQFKLLELVELAANRVFGCST